MNVDGYSRLERRKEVSDMREGWCGVTKGEEGG